MSPFTPDEQQLIQVYVREASDALGLKDWEVRCNFESAAADTAGYETDAEVHTSETQHAELRFSPKFRDHSPEKRRLIVAHELCHLHVAHWHEACEALSALLSKRDYAYTEKVMEIGEEHAVEAFARLLVDRLRPLYL